MNPKITTNWQRTQIKRLRSLHDHASTLPDEEMRRLSLRLLHLTEAVEALNSPHRNSPSYGYIANQIAELEKAAA